MPRLAWSALVALAVVCGTLCLHGAANVRGGIGESLRTAARHLFPLLVWALIAGVIYFALSRWQEYSAKPAFNAASWLTLKLRKPVKPQTAQMLFDGVLCIVRWILIPVLLLPLFSALSARGWGGFKGEAWQRMKRRLYWIQVPVLLLLALWLPLKMVQWVPHVGGFWIEMISMIVRVAIGYLLFVAGWLTLAFLSSGGNPLPSQPETAPSP